MTRSPGRERDDGDVGDDDEDDGDGDCDDDCDERRHEVSISFGYSDPELRIPLSSTAAVT